MTDHVLAALIQRRATLTGDLAKLQEQVQKAHDDLAALDAVIRQIDPEYPVGNIRPRYRRMSTPAEYGALSRAVLDHLRRAEEPLSVKELTDRIIAERGLNGQDRALVRSMRKRVDMALRYQRTNGMVEDRAGAGGMVLWKICS